MKKFMLHKNSRIEDFIEEIKEEGYAIVIYYMFGKIMETKLTHEDELLSIINNPGFANAFEYDNNI
jgi:hypothetical protein